MWLDFAIYAKQERLIIRLIKEADRNEPVQKEAGEQDCCGVHSDGAMLFPFDTFDTLLQFLSFMWCVVVKTRGSAS